MAMLAEPRRKQKWTLNPRGKHWSEDSNKFGQKMLEKMGWTAGKGLGANEQGMTEHVRVSFKNDSAGVGFKMEDLDKAWTEYQEGFNELLQELQKCQNSGSDDIVEVKCEPSNKKSLELKSKQSRARVHYQKFTRGKDINRYSSKDLANIFGQKELNVVDKAKEPETEEIYVNDPVGTEDKTAGVVTINSGSMTEYFKKMGSTLYKPPEYPKDNQSIESDCEITYTGFGFASAEKEKSDEVEKSKETACFENPCLNLDTSGETIGANDNTKVSKKRKQQCGSDSDYNLNNQAKKLKEDVTTANSTNGFVNVALNLETASPEVCNGKEFEVSRAEFGLTNCALDLTDEVKETRRVTFNDHVEYSDDCEKKKKKKKKKATLDKFEVENKKHKRKRKQESSQSAPLATGFVNEALDVQEVAEEINDNEVNERKSKKAKKRKDRRSNLETIPEAPDEEKEVREEQPSSIDVTLTEDSTKDINDDETLDENLSKKEQKKKKKKKKKSKEENNVEDTETNVSVEETHDVKGIDEEQSVCEAKDEAQEENSMERKKSKKKKKDKHKNEKSNTESAEVGQGDVTYDVESTMPNTNSDQAEDLPIERQDKFRLSIIKKKKKKKDKDNHASTDAAGENAAFDVQETVPEEKMECEPLEERRESSKEAVEQSSIKKEKKKKKKKKDIEMIETESNTKEEVSDKENTKVDKEEPQIKKSKKKKENKKESSGVDVNTCHGSEAEKRDSDSEKTLQNANSSESTPSKKNDDNNEISKFISSPWNEKAKMSKKLLKSIFHRNAISNFPGSNIHDIKGYGVDVQ